MLKFILELISGILKSTVFKEIQFELFGVRTENKRSLKYLPFCILISSFSFLFFNSTQAFFVDPSVKILEKKVHIQVNNSDNMQVDIYEKLENTANQDKDIIFTEALSSSAKDIQFFVESAGQELTLLQGQERLEVLADLAEAFQEPVFFRMGTENFGTFFQSQEINIPAKGIKHLKLSFTADLDFINDFYFSEIFLNNDKEIKDFELVLNLETEDDCKHFLNNSSQNALFEDAENQKTIFWSEKDFTPSENFKFFWSSVENSIMQFPYQGYLYEGYFITRDEEQGTRDKGREVVTILIDKSGSLFGQPWERVKEWLHFLLEEFNEETKIRIGFIGEEIEWYGENNGEWRMQNEELEKINLFYKNSFEFQKSFFEFFEQIKPVGKIDLNKSLEVVQENIVPDDNQVIILITDEDQTTNYKLQTTNIKIPLILLSFTGDEFSPLAVQARWSGGFFQRLFKNASSLIEKEEFLQKWGNQTTNFKLQTSNKEEIEAIEILPQEFRSSSEIDERFFVGRKATEEEISYAKSMSFLPRIWGARRVAELLQKEDFLEQDLEALLAVGRTFGIQTEFFNSNTTQKELKKNLGDNPDIRKEVLRLESLGIPEFFPQAFREATPLYRDKLQTTNFKLQSSIKKETRKERLISFDFWEKVKPETLLEIAPFSVAQKDLFVRFSEIFAEAFGTGEEVAFCEEFRCITVEKKKRENSIWLDRIFWRNFHPYHWANKYLWQLVKKEILEPEEDGDLLPEKGVSRAELAKMIYLLQKKGSQH